MERVKPMLSSFRLFSKRWSAMTFYQRFESGVAFALTLLITIVVIVALFRLFVGVINGLVFEAMNPLDHQVFQTVFGEIMTLLIALEFNHTLQYVVSREQSIIQTKIVLLIALLAVARKFIIMELGKTTPGELFGLAAVTLVLGIAYWFLREGDGPISQSSAQ